MADATDFNQLRRFMPTKEQEAAEQAKWAQMFNTAARAGAGGTRTGVPGLRPMGLKASSDFIDAITPGKIAKRKPSFSEPIDIPRNFKREDSPHKVRIVLPRTFCAECDRTDRPDGFDAGGCLNISLYTEDREDLGIKAMDVVLSSRCQECLEKQRAKVSDRANHLQMPDGTSRGQIADAQTLVLIKQRTEAYIRANRDNGIYVKS